MLSGAATVWIGQSEGGASRDPNGSFNPSASTFVILRLFLPTAQGYELALLEYKMFRPQLRQMPLNFGRAKSGRSMPVRQFSYTHTVAQDQNQPSGGCTCARNRL